MASNFEQYEPYHQKNLDVRERREYQAALEAVGMLKNNQKEPEGHRRVCSEKGLNDPVQEFHVDLAKDRAMSQLRWAPMPEDVDCSKNYPTVDPMGKFCQVDMDFAARLQRLESKAALRGPVVSGYVKEVLGDMEPDGLSNLGNLTSQMKHDCQNIRLYDRASKVALDRDASAFLEGKSQELQQSANIKKYDSILTGLEQICALKPGTPSPEFQKRMAKNGHPVSEDMLDTQVLRDIQPTVTEIRFDNLDNQISQMYFSDPRHWGKKIPNPQQMDAMLDGKDKTMDAITNRYACATVNQSLDLTFGPTEKRFQAVGPDGLNRSNLIAIEGETIQSRLRREYLESNQGNIGGYDSWYKENAVRRTNELVSAALMAGDHVEAFVPDANGKLPKEPTRLTRKGYEPTPLKKVTLNAWERHFAKHGFYKKKLAKAQRYEKIMACRDQMKDWKISVCDKNSIYDMGGKLQRETFFGDHAPTDVSDKEVKKDADTPNYYHSAGRAGGVSTCMYRLLADGYDLEDVMNPLRLQKEKREVGETYLQHYAANDKQWVGEALGQGMLRYAKEIDKLAASYDLSDPQFMREHAGLLYNIGHLGHEVGQNANVCKDAVAAQGMELDELAEVAEALGSDELAEMAKVPEIIEPTEEAKEKTEEAKEKTEEPKGKEAKEVTAEEKEARRQKAQNRLEEVYGHMFEKSVTSGLYLTGATKGFTQAMQMGVNSYQVHTQVSMMAGSQAIMKDLNEKMRDSPQVPLSERYKGQSASLSGIETWVDAYQGVTTMSNNGTLEKPEVMNTLSKAFLNGKLDKFVALNKFNGEMVCEGISVNKENFKKLGAETRTPEEIKKDQQQKLKKQPNTKEQNKQNKQNLGMGRRR